MSGCFPPPLVPAPDPCNVQIVTLNLYAGDLINPNEDERPRPVVVRLYQLTSDLRMLNAKYNDILLKDAEVLKDDILKVDEIEVFPNDLVEIKFERIPEAVMLAGVAMMHDPQGNSWKTYYEFPPMPNTPEACSPDAPEEEAKKEEGPAIPGAELLAEPPKPVKAPQAFPRTEFFVVERKIDNGGQYDASMFPNATPIRSISLPKASANTDALAQAPVSKK